MKKVNFKLSNVKGSRISSRKSMRSVRESISSSHYISKRKYGNLKDTMPEEDSDNSDVQVYDEDGNEILINEENIKDNVEQLGPFKTYMSLIKGFVCTGCLYYPRNVIEGGWGFIIMAMLLSCVLTMYCGKLLLDLRKKLKPKSYTDIGM